MDAASAAPIPADGAQGVATASTQPGPATLSTQYANWPQSKSFFPIAIWWQAPSRTGSDDRTALYTNEAQGLARVGANVFLSCCSQGSWPTSYGQDTSNQLKIVYDAGVAAGFPIYLIAGNPGVDPSPASTAANSINSIKALAASSGYQSTLIGYFGVDEPACDASSNGVGHLPTNAQNAAISDPTRPLFNNFTNWTAVPFYTGGSDPLNPGQSCLQSNINALQSSAAASLDLYPLTNSWQPLGWSRYLLQFTISDFATHPNDTMFMQALAVRSLAHFGRPNQTLWSYQDTGSDPEATDFPAFTASLVAGSSTITLNGGLYSFGPASSIGCAQGASNCSAWLGMKVYCNADMSWVACQGLPSGSRASPVANAPTIVQVLSPTQAVMSAPATVTVVADNPSVTGGFSPGAGQGSGCIKALNLCLPQGNELRATPNQVSQEAWMSVIAGATGLEWFCHDWTAVGLNYSFCMGGSDGTPTNIQDAINAANGLIYIDFEIAAWAPVLNSTDQGFCTMESQSFTTTADSLSTSCAGGILSLSTSSPNLPGMARVKSMLGVTYVLAIPLRCSAAYCPVSKANGGVATGATFTYTLAGFVGKTATVAYDSNTKWDPTHSTEGTSRALKANGSFTDRLGDNGDSYQVKIYAIK